MSEEKSMQELFDQARAESKLNDRYINLKVSNVTQSEDAYWRERQQAGAIKKSKEKGYTDKRLNASREAKAREVITPFGNYNSVSEYYNANPNAKNFNDNHRIKPHLYYYADIGPGNPTFEVVMYSPYGYLPKTDTYIGGSKRMYDLCIENNDEFALKYKDYICWWKRAKEKSPDMFYEKNEPKREWLL
jgi:hypothetical protein